jgi:hypothetical protein
LVFKPVEFSDLAKRLLTELGDAEVILRTAIGRMYYAAFLSARAKVPMHVMVGIAVKPADVHWAVRVAMKRMGHPEIASKLQTLGTLRHDADYEMGVVVTKDNYDTSLALAEDTLSLVGGLR